MKKKKKQKASLRSQRLLHYKAFLVGSFTALLLIVVSLEVPHPASVVLGASTTQQSQVFSFGNFFASLFSFFSGSHATQGGQSMQGGMTSHQATAASGSQTELTQSQLLAMAGNPYANGVLPLGDSKYTTSQPQQGYIYLCNVMKGGGGAGHAGSWLGTTTWTSHGKPTVEGSVSWPNATFSNTISGAERKLVGNGLPVGMTTGIFPIQSSDPASQYDRNPNTITAQSMSLTLPATPTYSDTPYCMGGEVGVMLDGVALFNGFDADMRDAAAHEVQDSCDAHPESNGEYHYHSLSRCFTNINETTVLGYALDGFPITGPKVADNKYLTTANLDECHGITSQIMLDGKLTMTYHYVMTQDFPYSASCFRGKPVSLQIIPMSHNGGQQGQGGNGNSQHSGNQEMQGGGSMQQQGMGTGMQNVMMGPPQAAITACSGQSEGASCSFTTQNGDSISGTCHTPPNGSSVLCVPSNGPRSQ